jgi:hypothetical protein
MRTPATIIYQNESANERSVDVIESNIIPPTTVTFKGQKNPVTTSEESPKVYEFESIDIDMSDDYLKTYSTLSDSKFLNKTESYGNKSFIINVKSPGEFDEKSKNSSYRRNQDTSFCVNMNEENGFANFSYKASTRLEKKHGIQASQPNQTLADLLPKILNDKDDNVSLASSLKNEKTPDDRLTEERLEAEIEQAVSGYYFDQIILKII